MIQPKYCSILSAPCPVKDECRFCRLNVVVNEFKNKEIKSEERRMEKLIDLIAKYPIGMKLRLSTQYAREEDLEVCGYSTENILFTNGTSVNSDRISCLIVERGGVNE